MSDQPCFRLDEDDGTNMDNKLAEYLMASKDNTSNDGAFNDLDPADLGINQISTQDNTNQHTNTDSVPLNFSSSHDQVLEPPSSLDQDTESSSLSQVLVTPTSQVLETPSSQVPQTTQRQMTGKQYSPDYLKFIRKTLGVGVDYKLSSEYRPDGLRKKVKTHVIGFIYEKLKLLINFYFRNKNLNSCLWIKILSKRSASPTLEAFCP